MKRYLQTLILAALLSACATLAQPSDTDSTASHPDTNSLKNERRAILVANNRYQRARLMIFPENPDSIAGADIRQPYHLFQNDGMLIGEQLATHHAFTTIPVCLRSNLNRFILYGFPLLPTRLTTPGLREPLYTPPLSAPNFCSTAELDAVSFDTPGSATCNPRINGLARPETAILWENGVFRENMLNVRFIRPLSPTLSLGLYSQFQHFDASNYSHTNGGIYSMFADIYSAFNFDTSYISRTGTNPLTHEHITTGLLGWHDNGSSLLFSYKYGELYNDMLIFSPVTSTTASYKSHWYQRTGFTHIMSGSANRLPFRHGRAYDAQVLFSSTVNRMKRLTDSANTQTPRLRRGETQVARLVFAPELMVRDADTLKIRTSFSIDNSSGFRNDQTELPAIGARFAYSGSSQQGAAALQFDADAGCHTFQYQDTLHVLPAGQASLSVRYSAVQAKLFGRHEPAYQSMPYDTINGSLRTSALLDPYTILGGEITGSGTMLSLLTGFYLMKSNTTTTSILWPEGIMPFRQPSWTIAVAPTTGRWHGLSVGSHWSFADSKPYCKSQNTVSLALHNAAGSLRFTLDCGVDFWSMREKIAIDGDTSWNRRIYDVNLKMATQFKTFRLYYRIDNLLNRRIAYMPGYTMPGLVFRWGFNWLIQG